MSLLTTFAGKNAPGWYVDSVGGNDGNSGRTSDAALQTIAALEAAGISTGDRIWLARGSQWREQLDIAVGSVLVSAYGSGNLPLLDASDVVSAGSWSKTGGQINVYEASVALGSDLSIQYVNAWEDNVVLTRAADVAACDAAAGSYYPSAEFGNITLYVHATDSSNPGASGKTYEVSVRAAGIDATSQDNLTIQNIHTRRNRRESGSLVVGRSCLIDSCTVEDGSKHSAYAQDGTTFSNCIIRDAYYGGANASLIIFNEDTPASLGITVTGCTLTQDASLSQAGLSGVSSHNNVSGDFGTLTVSSSTGTNLLVMIGGGDITNRVVSNCTANGCRTMVQSGACSTTAANLTVTGSLPVDSRVFELLTAGTSLTLDGLDLSGATLNATLGILGIVAISSVRLENCDFTAAGTAGLCRMVYLTNAGTTLYAHNNTYPKTNWTTVYYCSAITSVNTDSDYNAFAQDAMDVRLDGTSYASVAAYKLGTGQDANSTVG